MDSLYEVRIAHSLEQINANLMNISDSLEKISSSYVESNFDETIDTQINPVVDEFPSQRRATIIFEEYNKDGEYKEVKKFISDDFSFIYEEIKGSHLYELNLQAIVSGMQGD